MFIIPVAVAMQSKPGEGGSPGAVEFLGLLPLHKYP